MSKQTWKLTQRRIQTILEDGEGLALPIQHGNLVACPLWQQYMDIEDPFMGCTTECQFGAGMVGAKSLRCLWAAKEERN